jgi:hypothetical protein
LNESTKRTVQVAETVQTQDGIDEEVRYLFRALSAQ